MSVPTASAATGSTVDVLGTDGATVSLAVRPLSAGDLGTVKAIRGTTVVMRWTATADRSGRIAPHVPK